MSDTRTDHRNRDPQGTHKNVFMGGWTDAVNGKLYASIDQRKTHANMGNLFGWAFGRNDPELKEEVWRIYLQYSFDEIEEG